MSSLGARLVVASLVLASIGSTGCLGHDIWREPFTWTTVAELGESADAAAAFAGAIQSLGEQASGPGDQVVDDVESFPDGAPFQNLKDWMERNQPGSGEQFEDAVRVVTGNTSDGYATLMGQAAEAYQNATGPLAGTAEPVAFEVADRTTRVRWSLDVVLTGQEAPEPGQNPLPVGAMQVRIVDPSGRVRASYDIDTTRSTRDMVIEGTWGDESEVRSHLGGAWSVEVDANAEGAWSLVVEAYEPDFDDWNIFQVWRHHRRGETAMDREGHGGPSGNGTASGAAEVVS